jgi:hypothetical protein
VSDTNPDLSTRLDHLEELVVALADLHTSTRSGIDHPDRRIADLEARIATLGREMSRRRQSGMTSRAEEDAAGQNVE